MSMWEPGPRVHVEQDFVRDGVAVRLGRRLPDGRIEVVSVNEAGELVGNVFNSTTIGPDPTLRLPHDLATMLGEALVQHYGGHPETASLRRDYEAERARVDQLTRALIEANTALARALYDNPPRA